MSLISSIKKPDVDVVPFNTGTIYDLATGKYVPGTDGKWYIYGGLFQNINSVVGPTGAFKSTLAASMMLRSACLYRDSDAIIVDTESSISQDKMRVLQMAGEVATDDLKDRVAWVNGAVEMADGLFEMVKTLCDEKEKNAKDYKVETPFLDVMTGKAIRAWKPTYLLVDSLSALTSKAVAEMRQSKDISDQQTADVLDGNKKTSLNSAMQSYCQKYGIVLIYTAHFGKVTQLDPYNRIPKDTGFSPNDWKSKKVGSNLTFLSSVMARVKADPLLDSNKGPLYPKDSGAQSDLMELTMSIDKAKATFAGTQTPFVTTQTHGILNAITNYNYIRKHHEYFGMKGNKQTQKLAVYPEATLSRNTIRSLVEADYRLRRALEITAQYCYIQHNWYWDQFPVDFSKDPISVFDALYAKQKQSVIDEILESRGYWTYSKDPRKYMDIFHILELAGYKK